MYNACVTLRDFLTKIVIKIITLVQSAYLYAAAVDVDFHLDVGFSFPNIAHFNKQRQNFH